VQVIPSCILQARAEGGEPPVWHDRANAPWWADVHGRPPHRTRWPDWRCAFHREPEQRTIFATFGEQEGRPDGAAMDAEGCCGIADVTGGLLAFRPGVRGLPERRLA